MPGSLSIEVDVAGFPNPQPLPPHFWLPLDWSDLVWASITVGRFRRDLFAHGTYSIWEAVHRAGIIYAHFRQTNFGSIAQSPLYADLDKSEKGLVSYYLGMAVTKLVSAELGVHWLMHVDRAQHVFGMTFPAPGNTRPDLVGIDDHGRWIVAEAKGRSWNRDAAALAKMIEQKRSVGTIGGSRPHLAIGCLSYFKKGLLAASVVDPEKTRPDPIHYPFTPDQFVWAYYQPFVSLFRDVSSRDAWDRRVLSLTGVDVRISLDESIFELASRPLDQSSGLAQAVRERRQGFTQGGRTRPDGLGVEMGSAWDDEQRRADSPPGNR